MMFYDKVKIWLKGLSEYLSDMEKCEQDKDFHAEGNVLIHTKMVLDEVEKLKIPEEDKEILRWVALLHDIGKPYCSKEIDGHIRSHGHSRIGYHIAMDLIEQTQLEFIDKLQVLNIIRYHGEPCWIIETDKDPDYECIKMSMDCRLDLLYYFAKCDVLGRTADDKPKLLENIEYFKEYCVTLNCFNNPYAFSSSIAKYNYLVKKTHHHTDMPFDDTKSKVYMVCGLPGSGKNYYIDKAFSWLPVISLDEIRKELKIKPTGNQGKVIQLAKERAREFMRKGDNFVWNATNTTRQMRSGLINLFNEYNSFINITFINKSLKTILEQNNNRENKVPVDVIEKLYKKLDIPKNIEAHHISFIS